MTRALEQALGACIVLVVLLDVFLTVLYARAGTGILSGRLAKLTWQCFRAAAHALPSRRAEILSFCGPAILIALVALWAFGLTVGGALIMHPELGTSIRTHGGETPTDFVSAMYAAGSSMSIVSSSDFGPQTTATRLLFMFNSLVGTATISLTLTYLMQVYSALHRRNSLGLLAHSMSGETGDAAELVARLGPQGRFNGGYSNMSELAGQIVQIKEAHHFYPVLFYFRFHRAYYSVSRISLLALDAATLIRTALDDAEDGWLKESAAVAQLSSVPIRLLTTLEDTFVPGPVPSRKAPDARTSEQWRRRYDAALECFRRAGVRTTSDEQAGADRYVSLRAEWDPRVSNLAPALGYSMEEIDRAAYDPHAEDARRLSTDERPAVVS